MTAPVLDRGISGGVVSGGCLYVATVAADSDGRLRLVKSRSGEVVLQARDQVSLHLFTKFPTDFLQKRSISSVSFACAPENGTHKAAGSTYKIEAVLQLMPVEVTLIPSSSLAVSRDRWTAGAPGPDHERLKAAAAKLQSRAIEAAVYTLRAKERANAAAAEERQNNNAEKLGSKKLRHATLRKIVRPWTRSRQSDWPNMADGEVSSTHSSLLAGWLLRAPMLV